MEEERPDIKIEGNTATWEMRAEGSISGTYAGVFKFRCFLTPTQIIAAGRDYREMLGSNMALATENESMLAWALSQLKQRVISGPPFWKSQNENGRIDGDIPDVEIITVIVNAAVDAENKYKNMLKKRKEEALERAKTVGEMLLNEKKDKKDEAKDSESAD